MVTLVDTDALRARATEALLRSEIARRGPCPRAGGRCGCARPRGHLHCPTPSHDDATPSVSVDERDGVALWCCHGCGAGGDLVSLFEAADGLDRGAALRAAAALVGADTTTRDALDVHRRATPKRTAARLPRPAASTGGARPCPAPSAMAPPAVAQSHLTDDGDFLQHTLLGQTTTAGHDPHVSALLERACAVTPDSAAGAYLSARLGWGGPWPRSWCSMIAAGDRPRLRARRGWPPRPPAGVAHLLLWPRWSGQHLSGVAVEGLDNNGRRCGPDNRAGSTLGRYRRHLGQGLYGLRLGGASGSVVVEGELDALAAARLATLGAAVTAQRVETLGDTLGGWAAALTALSRVALVVAAPARSLKAAAEIAATTPPVLIVADADAEGCRAAWAAALHAEGLGVDAVVCRPWGERGSPEDMAAACARWPILTADPEPDKRTTEPPQARPPQDRGSTPPDDHRR